jgi:hypothetical protein
MADVDGRAIGRRPLVVSDVRRAHPDADRRTAEVDVSLRKRGQCKGATAADRKGLAIIGILLASVTIATVRGATVIEFPQ